MKTVLLISALVLMTACGKQVSKTNPKDIPKGNPGVVVNPVPTQNGQGFNVEISRSDRMSSNKVRLTSTFHVNFPTELKVENGTSTIDIIVKNHDESTTIANCSYHQVNNSLVWKRSQSCNPNLYLLAGDTVSFEGSYHKITEAQFLPQ